MKSKKSIPGLPLIIQGEITSSCLIKKESLNFLPSPKRKKGAATLFPFEKSEKPLLWKDSVNRCHKFNPDYFRPDTGLFSRKPFLITPNQIW
ncbi:MAG: hypothetical protein P8130_15900 [Deltaproteobacteria bacterium]